MRSRELTDNVKGKVMEEDTSDENKTINAIIQSLDIQRANCVLNNVLNSKANDRQTEERLSKNSGIHMMTLYEGYFSLRIQDGETNAGYVSKSFSLRPK